MYWKQQLKEIRKRMENLIRLEKRIKNEIPVKKGTVNKHGITVLSERKPQQEFINVQFDGRVNSHTVSLSEKEKQR